MPATTPPSLSPLPSRRNNHHSHAAITITTTTPLHHHRHHYHCYPTITITITTTTTVATLVSHPIHYSADPVFRVRKTTAFHLHLVCEAVGEENTLERVLPVFLQLCRDDFWGVRKACAESIVDVSKIVRTSVESQAQLVEVMLRLLDDSSKFVKTAAFKNLGIFVSTLSSALMPEGILASGDNCPILDKYIQMAITPEDLEAARNDGSFAGSSAESFGKAIPLPSDFGDGGAISKDPEFRGYCAYSYPAVLTTVGKDRWPMMKVLHDTLCRDASWKVRRTMSVSLHEVARILGPALAEENLLTSFDRFLGDIEEVKVGVAMHLAEFLEQLTPPCRESYLPIFNEIDCDGLLNKYNWRYREVVANQLSSLCNLFSPAATFSVINKLVFRLLKDKVAAVREACFQSVPVLLHRLGREETSWQDDLAKQYLELAESDVVSLRDFAASIDEQLSRLMDSTIGFIGLRQNASARWFSIVATVFMPPTLLGAVWGMNFKYMPELDDRYAYGLALLLMLLSATIPLWIARRMGWLSR